MAIGVKFLQMVTNNSENISQKPEYYGDIQPWAKVMKAVVSGISIIVFLATLFSNEHDVRGFFSSMLLSSSPVFVDLLVVFDSLITLKRAKLNPVFICALASSIICFASAIVFLILDGKNITVIDSFMNGSNWGWGIAFFLPIIFSFVINAVRPVKFIDSSIKTEPRQ